MLPNHMAYTIVVVAVILRAKRTIEALLEVHSIGMFILVVIEEETLAADTTRDRSFMFRAVILLVFTANVSLDALTVAVA